MLVYPLLSYQYRMQELDRCPSARNAYTFVLGWYRMGRHQQLQCWSTQLWKKVGINVDWSSFKIESFILKRFKILSNDIWYIKIKPVWNQIILEFLFFQTVFIFSIKVLKYLPVWMYATVFYYICVRIYSRVKKKRWMVSLKLCFGWFFLNDYRYILLFFIFITPTLEKNKQKQTKENNNNNNVQKNNQSIIIR